ncbi:MAG: dihydrolipoamide acetyltransferase family protein [Bacteroidales bacterium]|nr:dihydrolipoamide acetyltransferase family protein [Bacteroidales bacterium]
MANFDIIMPKMGESIEEATITNWFVKEGDRIEEDEVLLEIATDKVDSEIPSPVEGVVKKILFKQDEIVAVGTVIAVIDLEGDASSTSGEETDPAVAEKSNAPDSEPEQEISSQEEKEDKEDKEEISSTQGRFYSPLVKTIAAKEDVSQEELNSIQGSGLNGRVRKEDLLGFLEQRGAGKALSAEKPEPVATDPGALREPAKKAVPETVRGSEGDEVIEMSRLRKLIAEHMIRSKQTSAHVTNMIEVDVTSVVNWRNQVKENFLKREGVKLTYLPVFLEATVKALRDFPQINASVDGDHIVIKKKINLGIAVSLPDNNLIVPNIKDAGTLNLSGIARKMTELAAAARSNKLNPDDISGGTFTVTNFGSFQNDIGTPIINQPEVAILAVGAIKKKPAVIESPMGDMIAIRQKMWLSLTYDHRIVDGALGGAFLKRLGDYLESFDPETGNFKL